MGINGIKEERIKEKKSLKISTKMVNVGLIPKKKTYIYIIV